MGACRSRPFDRTQEYAAPSARGTSTLPRPRSPPRRSSTPRPSGSGLISSTSTMPSSPPSAAEKLKAGNRNAAFPIGSFPPGLPFVSGPRPDWSQRQTDSFLGLRDFRISDDFALERCEGDLHAGAAGGKPDLPRRNADLLCDIVDLLCDKFDLPRGNANLPGGKLGLPRGRANFLCGNADLLCGKSDLPRGKAGLPRDNANLLCGNVDLLCGNAALSQGKSVRTAVRVDLRRGRFTSWRYRAIVVSGEEGAQRERLKYVLSHGAKEGLVGDPRGGPASTPSVRCSTASPPRGSGSTGPRSMPPADAAKSLSACATPLRTR
jgi:hypothetical protein